MKVLVDTCVWSTALRRDMIEPNSIVQELRTLILEFGVQMIGPIRQELLSGLRSEDHISTLRDHLRAFPDLPLATPDFEKAAESLNTCRKFGVQGSNTDFLICAVSELHGFPIFTTDKDFTRYSEHLPIKLHVPRVN